MKTMFGAIALFIAVPVAAQAAEPADPQAGHAGQGQAPAHKPHDCCAQMMKHHGSMGGHGQAQAHNTADHADHAGQQPAK